VSSLTFTVAGEELLASSDKTLFWPARDTLFAADLHLGKEAAFRAGNIPIPPGSTAATLEALTRALEASGAGRLVVLGDMWHSRSARDEGTLARFREWRREHASVEMVLIVGNHDAKAGDLAGDDIDVSADPLQEAPFLFAHHPSPCAGSYVLAGHIHPSVTLEGRAKQAIRLPCFWFGREVGVLPSFGEFTGMAAVEPVRGDTVLVVAEGRVYRVC
jgi:uncharacterized protein